MTDKYDNGAGTAKHLLTYYFRLLADKAGVMWDSDNDSEVRQIVDALLNAAHEDAGVAIQDALNEHTSSEWHESMQDAQQEDNGAFTIVLRHSPRLEDVLEDCPNCGVQVGVLLWESGAKFLQVCPACGSPFVAWRDGAGDVQTDLTAQKVVTFEVVTPSVTATLFDANGNEVTL